MCRWLTILLLALLPLQLGWAALGAYCQHETGEQSKHFGHHHHQHKTMAGSEDDGGPDPKKGKSLHVHADCNACFFASITPILSEVLWITAHASSFEMNWFQAHPLFRPSSPPDRPDWVRLA